MQAYPQIKRFVQETLGCSCPEEVFDTIDCQREIVGFPGRRINVGDRLLIYIIVMGGESGIKGVVDSALKRGIEDRDKNGFNRFRLVLVDSRPDDLRMLAEQAFDNSGYADEKAHLHVVSESDIEGLEE